MQQNPILFLLCVMTPAFLFVFLRQMFQEELFWKIATALVIVVAIIFVISWATSSDISLLSFPFPAFIPLFHFLFIDFSFACASADMDEHHKIPRVEFVKIVSKTRLLTSSICF